VISLAAMGVKFSWRYKRSLWRYYIAFAFMAIAFSFSTDYTIYLNVALSVLAAFGFIRLYRMKWKLKQIRMVSTYLILCGFVFSFASSLNVLAAAEPDRAIYDSLLWLGQNQDRGRVISHDYYSPWVRYISGNDFYPPDEDIFLKRNLQDSRDYFLKNQIDYIFVTEEMKNGLVWRKPDEGLSFLFRNNETFSLLYNESGIQIWGIEQ
jgi:energy-coupling factor transporter transmembrane protein EcfT